MVPVPLECLKTALQRLDKLLLVVVTVVPNCRRLVLGLSVALVNLNWAWWKRRRGVTVNFGEVVILVTLVSLKASVGNGMVGVLMILLLLKLLLIVRRRVANVRVVLPFPVSICIMLLPLIFSPSSDTRSPLPVIRLLQCICILVSKDPVKLVNIAVGWVRSLAGVLTARLIHRLKFLALKMVSGVAVSFTS